ncbi:MAG: outer membrane protein assembly factor BamE [Proteobacteria bacterium]|nr:outer membrane protein assembly factor BamE [Pseudomonadota bacterium]
MKVRILFCALAALLLAGGCASSGSVSSAPIITEETLLNIKNGQSTREDVTKILGSPLRIFNFTRLNDESWEYRYTRGTWLMVLSVHFDTRNGKVSSYFSEPDPKIYSPDDNGS